MNVKKFVFLLLPALTACATSSSMDGGQYWQRVSASEEVYQQGPKAQQMLDRDLGRCNTDLTELQRLGALKNSIPTDSSGRLLDPNETKAKKIDTPEHVDQLLIKQSQYHDFDGCMLSKGWQRIYAARDLDVKASHPRNGNRPSAGGDNDFDVSRETADSEKNERHGGFCDSAVGALWRVATFRHGCSADHSSGNSK